jgi:ADP-heptose:LPS heptosyltransferase
MIIKAKPWKKNEPPRRILAIRLQATGDVVATLPFLQDLRNKLPPSVKLDLLTRKETDPIPRHLILFDRVYSIGGGRNFKLQLVHTFLLLPRLFFRQYDVVIDLQRTLISKIVRKMISPGAWSLFDKYAPIAGGERFRLTIEAVGLGKNQLDTRFRLKDPFAGPRVLKMNGWNGTDGLVVLNPAGAVATRHWPSENYVAFARLWLNAFPRTKFLVLGTGLIAEKTAFLKMQLGDHLISLVGKTTPDEAFAALQCTQLVLSEDSGLLHMAWTSGIPTVALLGSTRSDWVRPLGDHSVLFDSSDLPCGNCMQSVCRWGDVRCLTRYTPEMIFQRSLALIDGTRPAKQAGL